MTEENNKPEEFVPEFNAVDINKNIKMKTEFDYTHVNERGFGLGKFIFAKGVTKQPHLPIALHPITDPDVPGCTLDWPEGNTLKFALPEFIRAPGDTNKEMIGKHFFDNDVSFMYPVPVKQFDLSAMEKGSGMQLASEARRDMANATEQPARVGLTETGFAIPPLKRSTRKHLENAIVEHHARTRSQAREMIKRANARLTANWKKKSKKNARSRSHFVEVDFFYGCLQLHLFYKGKHAPFITVY